MSLLATAVIAYGSLGPQDDEANPMPQALRVVLPVVAYRVVGCSSL